jgi:AcrR family transcriptional regulator
VDAKQRGRPRNAHADTAILEAARDLMTAEGYERMTIEAIAARAGVGKQTVYRRWPSKAAIVAEAVMAGHLGINAEAPPQTGDAAADLGNWLGQFFMQLGEPAAVAVIRGLAAAATDGGTDAEKLYERFTGPSREQMLELLRAGVSRGQFRADLDIEAAADAISGTLLYRALIPPSAALDTDAAGFLDLLLLGMTPRTDAGGTKPGLL